METAQVESILKQFEIVEASVDRAKIPFWSGLQHKSVIEVSLWELMKAHKQIENMIREIAPERFGGKMTETYVLPPLDHRRLYTCPYCGNPECQSDHK
jgi:hypothetical protein